MVAYYDNLGVCCGVTPSSALVSNLSSPNDALLVSGFDATPPATATTMTIFGTYNFHGNPIGDTLGPAPIPGFVGITLAGKNWSTYTATITSSHATWSGANPPNLNNPFPINGGQGAIRASQGRIYVAQGDVGVRIYNATSYARTGQIAGGGSGSQIGAPGPSCTGLDISVQSGVAWLCCQSYSTGGEGGGLWLYPISLHPDTPTGTNVGTTEGGFSLRAFDNIPVVLVTSLAGYEGFAFS